MLSSTIKKAIFQSIPKTLTIGVDNFTVFVDYADRINVSEKLKNYDVVVTLRYFADRRDDQSSPINQIYSKELVDAGGGYYDIKSTKGERAQVTLSINVHAKGSSNYPAADMIDAYVDSLMTWYLRDLPAVSNIGVLGRSDVKDLAYLTDGRTARRQLDIFIAYAISYSETVTTIETIDYDVLEG